VGSNAAQTCLSIGSAVLVGQRVVHRAVRRSLATLTIVALFVGVTATAASAASGPKSLRAEVDIVGARFFAAQARAAALDAEIHALDRQLTRTRRRAAALRPVATAQAVQIYQGGSQGFTALFDTTNAMESARRAELIAQASDHTQALLDEYANAAANLEHQRRQVARARAAQAGVVAALAQQTGALEHALAQAQQSYRDELAAQVRARAATASSGSTPVRDVPPATVPAPPAPVPVAPPPPSPNGVNPHHDDPFLVCTRARESSGDYAAVNQGGYYGAYQFSEPTWDVTANHAGMPQLIGVRPDQASAWDQDQLAWVLYQWQGNAPWNGLC
jgi:Transglycosylase-like domain